MTIQPLLSAAIVASAILIGGLGALVTDWPTFVIALIGLGWGGLCVLVSLAVRRGDR